MPFRHARALTECQAAWRFAFGRAADLTGNIKIRETRTALVPAHVAPSVGEDCSDDNKWTACGSRMAVNCRPQWICCVDVLTATSASRHWPGVSVPQKRQQQGCQDCLALPLFSSRIKVCRPDASAWAAQPHSRFLEVPRHSILHSASGLVFAVAVLRSTQRRENSAKPRNAILAD